MEFIGVMIILRQRKASGAWFIENFVMDLRLN